MEQKCSCSIGCRLHSKWRSSNTKLSSIYHERTGFRDINLINTYSCYGNDKKANENAKQLLCMLANHEILNKIMKSKKYSPYTLDELNPKDHNGKGYCLGLNFGKGT